MVLNHVAKILTVGGAATRIRIEHDITFRGHPLELVFEDISIGCMRSTVNVQDERIFFRRIKVGWFLHPRLDAFAVKAPVRNFFRLGQVELRKKFLIDVGQLRGLAAASVQDEQIIDVRRRGYRVDNSRAIGRRAKISDRLVTVRQIG